MFKSSLIPLCMVLGVFTFLASNRAECPNTSQSTQKVEKEPEWSEEKEKAYRKYRTTGEENNIDD